ncbi:MAG: hypothetical protein RR957_06120, partial [Oscillospiraceae bacterium]
MNRNKKFTAFLMCLIMMVTMFSGMAVFTAENTTETIVSETGWPSFRGNAENMATVTSETPRSMDESHLKWNTKVTTGWTVSTPIIVGEFMYIATNEGLQKIDLTNGSVVQTAVLAGEMDYTPHLAYGDNKVFVPLKFGVIQAFDIETLAPLWKSSKLGEKDQSMTPIYYNDGNIYTGTYSGSGTYYCLTTSDDEPTLVDETKASKWTYKSAENANGYYWAGAVASGSNLIFGSENGVLTSLNTLTGAVIDTFAADSNIRSTI